MKSGGSESVNAGAVPLRPITGSVGCRIIDKMRRCTPKGAAKPWKTADNVELVERVAGAGVPVEELEAYVEGCSELVASRGEASVYWTVRQLFTAPTMDWWRNKVEAMRHAAEQRAAHELDKAARAERERIEREFRRRNSAPTPADLEVRRAAAPVKAEVLQRARMQELSQSVLSRLGGGASVGCPKCHASVSASESKCPACGQVLVDSKGHRRGGLRTVG